MPDSLSPLPEIDTRASETIGRTDVVFGWIFDSVLFALSIVALTLL
jgi:hypothetical protein